MSFPTHIPFVEDLGFRLLRVGDGEAEISVPLSTRLMNSFHVAHGGLSMTLLDVAMAHAARSVNRAADGSMGPGVVTIEMKTSFLRPGEGEALRAVGRLLHRTATMAFTEGTVYNGRGEACAHATGTFKYVRALPGQDRGIKALNPPPPTHPPLTGSGSD